ncbi:CIR protein [Plasmodium chabaudi chabaudi]|uniref:CIR protein n=1 Tax=Plasmodium chabaudi chabaudi TaxID=31271 RepID=A0A4V0K4Y4_PLACU|nr:CIR protein [Plasmodium chabaudi chabaudi]VTZ67605.1 CIR protein [Plasmodium chabaudi chabaudi]|eukprot:XP_016653370.1 CIR protein [Plasmodium chabaudi chabaudi]
MEIEACKLFHKVDELFTDKFVDEGKFNATSSLFYDYCPVKGGYKSCDTDYERISAIGGYLFMELDNKDYQINGRNRDDKYIEYFIMWISNKLYKIATNHIVTLNQSYKEHLGKSIGNFNFWNLVDKKKELKDANVAIMNLFYVLFKQICETVKTYQTKHTQSHEYINKAAQSYIIYEELSKFVNQCGPYHELLEHLKTIYDGFTETVINENRNDKQMANKLMKFPSIDKLNSSPEFKSRGCKHTHKNFIKKPPRIIRNEIKKLKAAIKKNPHKEFKLIDSQDMEDEDDDYSGEDDEDDDYSGEDDEDDDYSGEDDEDDDDDAVDEDIDDDSDDDDNEESGNVKLQDEQLEKKNAPIGPQSISQDSAKYNIPTTVTQTQSSGSASRDTATQSGKASIPSTPRNPPGKPESSVPPKQVDLKPVPAQTGAVKPTPPQPTSPQPIPSQSTPTQRTNLKSPSKQSAPEKPPLPAQTESVKPTLLQPTNVKSPSGQSTPAKQPLPAQKEVVKPATQQKAEQIQHQPQPKSAKPEPPRSTKQPPNALSTTTTGASITPSAPKKPENIKLALPEAPPQPQKEPKIPQSSKATSEKPVSAQTAAVKLVPARQAHQAPAYTPNIKSPPEQSLPSPPSRKSPKYLPSTVSGTSTTPSTVSGTSTTPSTVSGTSTTPSTVSGASTTPSASTTTIPSIKRILPKQNDTSNQISRVPTSGVSEGLINIPINGSGAIRDQLSNQHSTTENSGHFSKKNTGDQMNSSSLNHPPHDAKEKTINQALESNDQRNKSKNVPNEQSIRSHESPDAHNKAKTTQDNTNAEVYNLKNPTVDTGSQQKNLRTKREAQNGVLADQGIISGSSGVGLNSSGVGTNISKQSQKVSPETTSAIMPSQSPSSQTSQPIMLPQTPPVTSLGTQTPSPKPLLQPEQLPSITLSSSSSETTKASPITINVSTDKKAETAVSSIESPLPGQNYDSKGLSRRKRSTSPVSLMTNSTSEPGVTSDASSSTTVTDVKYLPFGSRKKSKKKKITKKVINLVDGRKMEKTFIKSIDREKKSNIIINSGDNKKIAKIIINSDDTNKPIKMSIDPWDEKRKTHITINSDDNIKPIKEAINPWDEKQKTDITINSDDNIKPIKEAINPWDEKRMTHMTINSDDNIKPIKKAINPWDEKQKTDITINSDDNIKPIKEAINPWDEKQKTDITINSEHTKKYTKSVINSGDRKKTKIIVNSVNEKISLLNIYKFMKADPMPFINLFFLVIFFVYKRKRNTIE